MNELVKNWRVSKGLSMPHHRIEGNFEIERILRNSRKPRRSKIIIDAYVARCSDKAITSPKNVS